MQYEGGTPSVRVRAHYQYGGGTSSVQTKMCNTKAGVQYRGGTPEYRGGCAVRRISHIIITDHGHYGAIRLRIIP